MPTCLTIRCNAILYIKHALNGEHAAATMLCYIFVLFLNDLLCKCAPWNIPKEKL